MRHAAERKQKPIRFRHAGVEIVIVVDIAHDRRVLVKTMPPSFKGDQLAWIAQFPGEALEACGTLIGSALVAGGMEDDAGRQSAAEMMDGRNLNGAVL